MAALFAFLAAFSFAMASVGQQRVATHVPTEHTLRVGLLVKLGTNRRWLLATGVDVFAFVLEAIALGLGSLILIQAILPSSLLFALPVGARLTGKTLSRREWLAALAVAGGIAAFLTAAAPGEGRSQAPATAWFLLVAILGCGVAALVILGLRSHEAALKAGCWATAGAVTYAFLAAVTKSLVDLLGHGVAAVITSWQPYALAAAAILGTLLIQSAFQVGSLTASLPLMVLSEPVAGTLIGSTLFEEQINGGAVHIVVMVLALGAMFAGVTVLSRSPLARYLA